MTPNNLLSSRLYCRLRNHTESCLAARGLYHRWGITPRPEDPDSIAVSIYDRQPLVNPAVQKSEEKRSLFRPDHASLICSASGSVCE